MNSIIIIALGSLLLLTSLDALLHNPKLQLVAKVPFRLPRVKWKISTPLPKKPNPNRAFQPMTKLEKRARWLKENRKRERWTSSLTLEKM